MSIDLLTNTAWLTPQTDFLLYLQDVRNYLGKNFSDFLLSITFLGEYFLPAIISAVIYWCIDNKKGSYLFLLCSFNICIVQFMKMTACIYRPWVLNPNITPAEKAFLHAGGYSFPSGHSSMSSSFWGGMGYLFRRKFYIWFHCIFIILLVGFSRLFLGVHTPQDVLTGYTIGIVLTFSLLPLVDWLEKDKKRCLILLLILDIIFALIIFYIFNKSYPVDYLNGKILVNPQKSIYNSIISFGLSAGFVNGLLLHNGLFDMNNTEVSKKVKILRAVIGVLIMFFLFPILLESCFKAVDINNFYGFLKPFILGFFVTFIYPLSFKFIK